MFYQLGGHYIAYTALPPVSSSNPAPPEEVDPTNAKSESAEEHSKPTTAKPASDERQWAFISDTVVRLTTLEEVLRAKAYICMYERC
jgi:ubiquitin carboxyl-terminal hydrolase 16/45